MIVNPIGGQHINISSGDFVTFTDGMNFRGMIHQAISKHFRFGD